MTYDPPLIEYMRDRDVSDEDDRRIRALLSTCFTGPDNQMFRDRRYAQEPPQHRWLMRSDDGGIIAHVALHVKVVGVSESDFTIGGIAEVCTHPDHRRRGYAKALLAAAHAWMSGHNIPFAILFGVAKNYQSSGYRYVRDPIRYWDWRQQVWVVKTLDYLMVCSLTERPWPEGKIDLRGPCF